MRDVTKVLLSSLFLAACGSTDGSTTAAPVRPAVGATSTAGATAPATKPLLTFEGTVDVHAKTLDLVVRSPSGAVRTETTLPYGTGSGDVYFHTCGTPTYTTSGAGGSLSAVVQAVNNLTGAVPDLTVKIDSVSDTGTTFATNLSGNLYGSVPNTGATSCAANTATWTFTQATTTNFTFVGEADGTPPSSTPPPPPTVTQVSIGAGYACALLSNGGIDCWGQNGEGQLGNGTTTNSLVPTPVIGLSSSAVAVSTKYYTTCALLSTGGVECWGDNAQGALGDGSTAEAYSSVPVAVTGLAASATAISVGDVFACAVLSTGAVQCWGYNVVGQLGNGTTTNSSVPVTVTGLPSAATAVACDQGFACAETTTEDLCWGSSMGSFLPPGESYSSVPVYVGVGGAEAIAIDEGDTCVLADGDVSCWGGNLGDGSETATTTSAEPAQPETLFAGVAAVSPGNNVTCALLTTGGVDCWGSNYYGTLGNGTTTDAWIPQAVPGLSSVAALTLGEQTACALLTSGKLECWGSGVDGVLGNGGTANSSVPVEVTGF